MKSKETKLLSLPIRGNSRALFLRTVALASTVFVTNSLQADNFQWVGANTAWSALASWTQEGGPASRVPTVGDTITGNTTIGANMQLNGALRQVDAFTITSNLNILPTAFTGTLKVDGVFQINSGVLATLRDNNSLDYSIKLEAGTLNVLGSLAIGQPTTTVNGMGGVSVAVTNLSGAINFNVSPPKDPAITDPVYDFGTLNMDGGVITLAKYGTAGTNRDIQVASIGGETGNIQVKDGAGVRTGSLSIYGETGQHDFGGTLVDGHADSRLTLSKSGAGIQILSGNNTYTGQTVISGGALLVNGTHSQAADGSGGGSSANGLYRVESSATLGGSGRIAAKGAADNTNMILMEAGSQLSPGSGVGNLILDGAAIGGNNSTLLNMAAGAEFSFQLEGDGSGADRISFWNYAGGDLLLNDNVINLSLNGPLAGGTYTAILFDFYSDAGGLATSSGIVGGLTLDGAVIDPGIAFANLIYNANNISLEYTVVPEPSAPLLFLLTGAGFVLIRRLRVANRSSLDFAAHARPLDDPACL